MLNMEKVEELRKLHDTDAIKNLPIDVLDKPIGSIISSLPKLLVNKIENLNLKKVRDLLTFHPYEIVKIRGFGQKSIDEFCDLILKLISTPEVIKEYERAGIKGKRHRNIKNIFDDTQIEFQDLFLPGKDFGENLFIHIIDVFSRVYKKYCELRRDPKIDLVISKRFLQPKEKQYTLEQIGLALGVTRERVRQIESEATKNLSEFVSGTPYFKLDIKLNIEIVEAFNQIKEFVKTTEFGTTAFLLEELNKKFNISPNKASEQYLLLLLHTLGWELIDDGKNEFIINSKYGLKREFLDISKSIILKCKDAANPLSEIDILIFVRTTKKWRAIAPETLKLILNRSPYLNKVIISGEEGFQLKFEYLSSDSDRAFYILKEYGKPTHYKDIEREIAHRMNQFGKKVAPSERYGSKLSTDPRFSPIGKSGLWGLREWNHERKTIKELAVEYLLRKNLPVEKREIVSFILSKRDVPSASIYTVISYETGSTFLITEDNKVILKDWQRSYNVKSNDQIKSESISEKTISIVKASEHQISLDEIILALGTKSRGQKWTLSGILAKHPAIISSISNGTKLFSYNKTHEPGISSNGKTKYDKCKDVAIRLLSIAEDKKLPLKILKEKVSKEVGCHSALVYTVIEENLEFKKVDSGKKSKIVQLRDLLAGVSETTPTKSEIELIIEKGESSILEFKSSLRFDLQTTKKNVELEFVVLKTIAGFANSAGGQLLIGVSDDGNVLGLDSDYSTFSGKGNRDIFERHLSTLIGNNFGTTFLASKIRISFEKVKAGELCRVLVSKSDGPINLSTSENGKKFERFYVRMGNSTREMSTPSELYSYFQSRFLGSKEN